MRKWTHALLLIALPAASFFVARSIAAAGDELRFTDVRKQTVEFMAYERNLRLTPDQQAIWREALQGLEAPCCPENTALTCCCPCNAAKAWWGLAKHLVADRGYDAAATRAKVGEWFRFINPSGWKGDTCSTNGCGKPFAQSGCGGMRAEQLVF